MSIYASIGGVDDTEPCGPPWTYPGPRIVPSITDPRESSISLARIPSHITADGRDDQPEDGHPWPWLRVSVDDYSTGRGADVLINPEQARHLAAQLTTWADRANGQPQQPITTAETTVPVPAEALDALVRVAAHVSVGRSAAFLTPYPDATARRALGALHDAGLLTLAEPVDQPAT
ncbi:hypothetical protein AB0E67_27315 [Streptomyces sp. NPDC032161]|uniref:hypothetical protein n=1 Tax=unclassified Streptomyces TaxID=2593676 RepID=UPI0033FAC608